MSSEDQKECSDKKHEVSHYVLPKQTSTTTQSSTPTKATIMNRLQDNKDESLKSGPSFKDTEEFKSLIAQFNNIFKFWSKEGRKREQHFEVFRGFGHVRRN